jgi:hypothetical protein
MMNERIKDLYIQALCEYEDANGVFIPPDFVEKFAELIVRECMTTILKESKWYWDKDEFESSNAIQNAAKRLKEHFGVGE